MESNFSLFRTSLNSSMYNHKYNNNNIGNLDMNFQQQKKVVNLNNDNSPHNYDYINLSKPNQYIPSKILFQRRMNNNNNNFVTIGKINILHPNSEQDDSPKLNSILKKSKFNNLPTINKKISFQNHNLVIIVMGKEYYVDNNIKNDIWWSSKELEFIRNMFKIEASKLQKNYPHMSMSQCIKELCKRS